MAQVKVNGEFVSLRIVEWNPNKEEGLAISPDGEEIEIYQSYDGDGYLEAYPQSSAYDLARSDDPTYGSFNL